MTINDRIVVDVGDLQVTEFVCKSCGVAVTYPTVQLTRIPTQCPGCGVQWVVAQTEAYQMLTRLAIGLRTAIANAENEGTGYRLRFHLERPK